MFGKKQEDSTRAMSVGKDKNAGCMRVLAPLFFGMFLAAGCAMLYFFAFKPLWGVYSASGWQATPCVVTSSRLVESRGDDSTNYRIEIKYKYTFNGKQYHSDQYDFVSTGSNSGVESKRQVVRNHPVGKKTSCYVNPSDPKEAVIERGMTWDMLWGLFGVPFFLIGAIGLLFSLGIIKWKPRRAAKAEWLPTVKHQRHTSDWEAALAGDEGPVTLKPTVGPVAKLLMILFFACIWNGIVAAIIYKVMSNMRRGQTETILVVFAVVFGLVGLVLIGCVLYAFLKLFTPRPTLTVNSAQILLGGTLDLAWRFAGQTGSLRRLHIYLEGREEATYRRGTDTYTDKETFATHTLVDTTDFTEMPHGETQFSIPSDTMHSFDAGHNDIVWTLHVKGEIERWPDVAEEYTLLLVPPGMETLIEEDLERP